MKDNTKKTLKIYWRHSTRYPWVLFFMLFSGAAAAAVSSIYPLYLRDFINLLSSPSLNRAIALAGLHRTLVIMLFIGLANWLFWRLLQVSEATFETRVMKDLSESCYRYLHKHSFTFFINNFTGSLVKRVKWFTNAFEAITDQVLWNLEPLLVQMVITLVILGRLNIWLGVGLFVWAIIFIIFNWSFTKYKLQYDIARNKVETEASGLLADTIANHSNVKLFGGYEREMTLFDVVNEKLRYLRIITWNYLSNTLDGIQALLSIALEIGILYYSISLWDRGILSVGDFVLIEMLLIIMIGRIWNVGRVIRTVYERLADAEEMTIILDTPHEIRDIPVAKKLKVNKGEIEFSHVVFNYHETRQILKDFSLVIRPGERIAFVGPSGAGKTTLTRLLLRQHELTNGHILIDGQDITRVTQESLWAAISLVPQEPILFHRTIKENIRYGQPAATDEEVTAAAKAARCHDFIIQTPDGYETYVGERGIKLSGGERQRVAIARAILRNAPILVLDEATSSLDSESELLIQEALGELMRGKTAIVIAHRLSTVKQMNRIIVIDDGKIQEEGSHDWLTQKEGGLYNRLWQLQAGGFIQ